MEPSMIIESLWNNAKFSMLSGNLEEMKDLLNHAMVLAYNLESEKLILTKSISNTGKIDQTLEIEISEQKTAFASKKISQTNFLYETESNKNSILHDTTELKMKVEI